MDSLKDTSAAASPLTGNDSFRVAVPQIALPKGGGAIRGIGEKFSANPVTGTGSMSVPIFTSTGRAGFGPQLGLSYDSGAGNGVFGLGWQLALPAITRKTDKGLPSYHDAPDSDIFILSGSEDLVPLTDPDEKPRAAFGNEYFIRRYRPRVEGLFARIERWSNVSNAEDVCWRSISRDNITTWYGKTEGSRIADPTDASRIFSWLICESYDDKGNLIAYSYVGEDVYDVHLTQSNERNRLRTANRYPRSICYGNQNPYTPDFSLGPSEAPAQEWHFEVLFDYHEGNDLDALLADPKHPKWTCRPDPFSSYRAGFEVRTYRLCQRILMLHHFTEEAKIGTNYLVKSTNFEYLYDEDPTAATNPIFSKLISLTQTGHQGALEPRSLPPLEFTYSEAVIDQTIQQLDPDSMENLPYGLDGARYQWVDLDGEGASGILSEQAGAWFYKRNLSPVTGENGDPLKARFAPAEVVRKEPAPIAAQTREQLLDLAGDGALDLVEFGGPEPGYYKREGTRGWRPMVSFDALPSLDWNSPNLKFVDLTGDGHADLLISEEEVFLWHPSLAEEGFGAEVRVSKANDEEKGPAVLFADSTETIFLADFSGDGLTDIIRIRNGEVCYWPNLGYGRFGGKVDMDNAPWFEAPDLFDGRRVRLADIDGSGTTDIIYLASDGVQIYFNQSGNSWSAKTSLDEFPAVHNLDTVLAADLLGNGTACLVWSSPLPGDYRADLSYMDLMGGQKQQKPHLLIETKNNLGATTTIQYAPSTKFYLLDKESGNPWLTRLPFPVHCVEQVTVHDRWRDTTFSSSYSYHHGYYDGIEREFRGFGRIEQVDIEDYDKFAAANNSPYITQDQRLYQPPVKTVTWYHTGVFVHEKRLLSHYSHEYFPNWLEAEHPEDANLLQNFKENQLPEPDFADQDLSAEEWREALRACKGMLLRQEVYELDVAALADKVHKPVKLFSTAYHNCHIRRLQPRGPNPYAVFLVTESEAITYQYELALNPLPADGPDPRTTHALNLKVDDFGHVLQSVSLTYGRRTTFDDPTLPPGGPELIQESQAAPHFVFTQSSYTDAESSEGTDDHRIPVPWEIKTYEFTGLTPEGYVSIADLRSYQLGDGPFDPASVHEVTEIPYHQVPDGTLQQRVVEHVRTLYVNDDLTPLPIKKLGKLGLKYEDYKLALTDKLLSAVFGNKLNDSIRGSIAQTYIADSSRSGYLNGDDLALRFAGLKTQGQYWIRSGTIEYDPIHFYVPMSHTDAFGNTTSLSYDYKGTQYFLFLQSVTDHHSNTTSVEEFDFRVLAPCLMKDANGNLSEIAFDRLGMPAAMALLGKGAKDDSGKPSEGDSLETLSDAILNPTVADVRAFFTSDYSEVAPRQWLDSATARYVYWFGEELNPDDSPAWSKHPPAALGILRETHVASLTEGQQSKLQVAVEYSDGLGFVLVKKAQAEADPLAGGALRWIASGKTILNNKGKPVKQFEPNYSPTEHQFDEAEAKSETGVTPILYYDAPGRLIRTDSPDGSYSKVEFDPWQVVTWDQNDTVLDSTWYTSRNPVDSTKPLPTDLMTGQLTVTADQRAAWLAARCSGTPSVTLLDTLGRNVITVSHNRVEDAAGTFVHGGKKYRDDKYLTFTKLDSEGKPLWIRDARGNLVMQYIYPAKANNDPGNDIQPAAVPCYDIAGSLLFQHSMDSGDRWIINDAAGKPMFAWDQNLVSPAGGAVQENRLYFKEYDALHRPKAQWLSINNAAELMTERFEYRDASDNDVNALANNLQGQLVRHYDPSGVTETIRRDFKGNVEEVHRTLNNSPEQSLIDWQNLAGKLSAEVFVQITEYDALNRISTLFNWHRQGDTHAAQFVPFYNQRGVLLSETLTLRSGDPGPKSTLAIQEVRYNEKGQKTSLALASGTLTQYEYDPQTFRLKQVQTTRPADSSDFPGRRSNLKDPAIVQQLLYTYDPVGNITEIEDQAYEPVFFDNQKVEAHSRYEYDALYRLISASGRESAQGGDAARDGSEPSMASGFPVTDQTLRCYTQTYQYDSVGNFITMTHAVKGDMAAGWTRHYETFADSNRLHYTWTGSDRVATQIEYRYDTHGSMLNFMNAAPGQDMRWDHRDMIASIDLGGRHAFYQYDASKQRTRKIVQNGIVKERIYLGGYELYRETRNGELVKKIESHHLFEGEQRVLLVDDVLPTKDAKQATGPLFRYQYSNHLGSSCLELRDDTAIISYEEFHPYGTSAYRAMNANLEAPAKRYRYAGMERDEESGLNYHRDRYYIHWLGMWISPDPSGLRNDTNLYQFVRGNPIGFTDPNGRAAIPKEYLALPADVRQQLENPPLLPRGPSSAQQISVNKGPEISPGGPLDPKVDTPAYQRQIQEKAYYESHPIEAIDKSAEEFRKTDTVSIVAQFGGAEDILGGTGGTPAEPANTQWKAPTYEPLYESGEAGVGEFHPDPREFHLEASNRSEVAPVDTKPPDTPPADLPASKRPWRTPAVQSTPLPDNPLTGVKVGDTTLYGPFYRTDNVKSLMEQSGEWWGRGIHTGAGYGTPEALAYTKAAGPIYSGESTQFFTITKPRAIARVSVGWPTHTTFGLGLTPEPYPGVRGFTLLGEDWAAVSVYLPSVRALKY